QLFCVEDNNRPAVTQRPPIEIGDGWFALVDALCSTLQFIDPATKNIHVRTRSTCLRFRCWPTNQTTYGAIHTAQALSMRICEATGSVLPNLPDISQGKKGSPGSFIGDDVNTPSPALPPGLFILLDVGFRFISKRSALRSDFPTIEIETCHWDNARGLVLTPSTASIHAATIAQIERATMYRSRRGHKGRIDKHIEKMVARTNAAGVLINEISKRMDKTDGHLRTIDDFCCLMRTRDW
ncbi:hypothetical protein, partial [Acidocella sp. MX-AZ02]|uniref:hypothetical protein n=1 Tax=Acidocella sp. MX-AZ02 TaxID=1214225 RepID=UPI001969FD17